MHNTMLPTPNSLEARIAVIEKKLDTLSEMLSSTTTVATTAPSDDRAIAREAFEKRCLDCGGSPEFVLWVLNNIRTHTAAGISFADLEFAQSLNALRTPDTFKHFGGRTSTSSVQLILNAIHTLLSVPSGVYRDVDHPQPNHFVYHPNHDLLSPVIEAPTPAKPVDPEIIKALNDQGLTLTDAMSWLDAIRMFLGIENSSSTNDSRFFGLLIHRLVDFIDSSDKPGLRELFDTLNSSSHSSRAYYAGIIVQKLAKCRGTGIDGSRGTLVYYRPAEDRILGDAR